jgi:hypothetical protein
MLSGCAFFSEMYVLSEIEEVSRGGATINNKIVAPFRLIGDYQEQHGDIAGT